MSSDRWYALLSALVTISRTASTLRRQARLPQIFLCFAPLFSNPKLSSSSLPQFLRRWRVKLQYPAVLYSNFSYKLLRARLSGSPSPQRPQSHPRDVETLLTSPPTSLSSLANLVGFGLPFPIQLRSLHCPVASTIPSIYI